MYAGLFVLNSVQFYDTLGRSGVLSSVFFGERNMKLLIADDHTLFRDALVQYIERAEPSAEVVLARDFYQVEEKLAQDSSYDLILLDMRMPGMRGLEGLRHVTENYPENAVALMSGVAEPEDVRHALDLGVSGYFPKTMTGKGFIAAIRQVLDGGRFVPVDKKTETFAPSYHGDMEEPDSDAEADAAGEFKTVEDIGFTPREVDVLSHLLQGESNKEIAHALDLQVVTVKLHVRGICRKLNAKNRTQAAMKARELGIIKYTAMAGA